MLGHRANICETVFSGNDAEFALYFDTWLTFDAPRREPDDDADWVHVETPAHTLDSRHTRQQ